MPCSVRCRCSVTDASVWAAVRYWVASSLCVPATSRTSDAWERTLAGLPELSRPRTDVWLEFSYSETATWASWARAAL